MEVSTLASYTVSDFVPGDTVVHVFHGRYFHVTRVGRKYVYCTLTIGTPLREEREYRFLPASLRLVFSTGDE